MSSSEVIIDEGALVSVSESLKTYISEYRTTLENALRKLKSCGDDWNDEDFNSLVSAINSFMADVDNIENSTGQLTDRIDKKIAAIHQLHNMKI